MINFANTLVVFFAISILAGLVFSKGKRVILVIGAIMVVFIALLLVTVIIYCIADLWLLHQFLRHLLAEGVISWW